MGGGCCSLRAACGLSLKVYFLESNEPLNVIKQKTERLSQRLFIGRSNIEPNVPKSISHQFLPSLPRRGLFPSVVEIPAQNPKQQGQTRDCVADQPLALPCVFLLFHLKALGWEPGAAGQALDQSLLSSVCSGTKAPSCLCSAQALSAWTALPASLRLRPLRSQPHFCTSSH